MKKTKHLLKQAATVALFMLPLSFLVAQNGWLPHLYLGIPTSDRQIVFNDEFENNDNEWNLNSSYLTMKIEGGDFYCESQNSKNYVKTYVKRRFIPINQSGDYEIEISMRYVKGKGSRPLGLTFGRDVAGNEYNFYFSSDGKYKILKSEDGKDQNYVNWTSHHLLRTYSYNTLTVRKTDQVWYFFINRDKVFETEAEPLFGYDMGFTIGEDMAIEVDYLKISELKNGDNEGPSISITSPELDAQSKVELSSDRQVIRGRVTDPSGIAQLTINEHTVIPGPLGEFSASVRLPLGTTRIQVEAIDNLMNKSSKIFFMDYVTKREEPPFVQNGGKNYLITIGINNYSFWSRLHNATKDCKDLSQVLKEEYHFDDMFSINLTDRNATRENILEAFESLQDKVTPNDNLLIYYAGHGYYDDNSDRGYWVPVDARQNKIVDYIRNSTIHDYLSSINSHNTLLIVDACYAGSLFGRTRGVLNEESPSRWAFTSGDIEKVWDGQPGENSPFAKYLISYLRQNNKKKLHASELINNVKAAVMRNTNQTPQGDPLQNVGDLGGVFIFYKK